MVREAVAGGLAGGGECREEMVVKGCVVGSAGVLFDVGNGHGAIGVRKPPGRPGENAIPSRNVGCVTRHGLGVPADARRRFTGGVRA
jgi:hypothetical protein